MHLYSGGCLCPLSISICPLRVSHAFGEMIAQNIVCVEVLIPVSEHFAGLDILQSSKTKVLGEGTSREQTLEGRALEELSWDILKIFDLIFLTIS